MTRWAQDFLSLYYDVPGGKARPSQLNEGGPPGRSRMDESGLDIKASTPKLLTLGSTRTILTGMLLDITKESIVNDRYRLWGQNAPSGRSYQRHIRHYILESHHIFKNKSSSGKANLSQLNP